MIWSCEMAARRLNGSPLFVTFTAGIRDLHWRDRRALVPCRIGSHDFRDSRCSLVREGPLRAQFSVTALFILSLFLFVTGAAFHFSDRVLMRKIIRIESFVTRDALKVLMDGTAVPFLIDEDGTGLPVLLHRQRPVRMTGKTFGFILCGCRCERKDHTDEQSKVHEGLISHSGFFSFC